MLGYAEVIDNQEEVERIFALFQEKFVPMSKAGKEFLDRHVIVKVSPVEARFIDNTVSFGHNDIVHY
jgi:hypothetical protein